MQFDFEDRDGRTVVRLRDGGYRDTPRSRRALVNCAAGWGEALTLLTGWPRGLERSTGH